MSRFSGYKRIILGLLMLFMPLVVVAQVSWVKDFDQALKQAAKEKKFIVLDISASW